MKVSQLLKLMLIAALPMRVIEDETAGAEPSSTEAGKSAPGEISGPADGSTRQESTGAVVDATSASLTSIENGSADGGALTPDTTTGSADSPNVATLAASASASGTSSSVPSALPVDGTAAAASSDPLAGEQGNSIAAGSAAAAQPVTSDTTTAAPAASGSTLGAGEQGNAQPLDASTTSSSSGLAVAGASPVTDVGSAGIGQSGSGEQGNGAVDVASGATATSGSNAGASGDAGIAAGDSGNVLAGGAPLADTTSDSIDEPTDDHPAKPHLAALRRKIESGEAIIMADLLRLIHAIEETL